MIKFDFSFDDTEDPPSQSYQNIQYNFSKIILDPMFKKFEKNTLISIVFVNDSIMQKMNQQYRGKNGTTDVLSFSLNEALEDDFLLGEIVISTDKAKLDAESFGISYEKEVLTLLVHGVAHLLGYDHENDQQEIKMKEIENKLITQISLSEGLVING